MIYLASPYSDPDPTVRLRRAFQAQDFVLQNLRKSIYLYSPIMYYHGISVLFKLPSEFEFWRGTNEDALANSDALWVLKLEGWERSRGIQHELAFAAANDIPIEHVEFRL